MRSARSTASGSRRWWRAAAEAGIEEKGAGGTAGACGASDPAARRGRGRLAAAAALALAAGIAAGSGGGRRRRSGRARAPGAAAREAVDRLSLRQQVGQLTISSFPGARPPAYIRRRLRAGETAGVILFGFNAGPPAQWQRLTRSLQRTPATAPWCWWTRRAATCAPSAGPVHPPASRCRGRRRRCAPLRRRPRGSCDGRGEREPRAGGGRAAGGSTMSSRAFAGDAAGSPRAPRPRRGSARSGSPRPPSTFPASAART